MNNANELIQMPFIKNNLKKKLKDLLDGISYVKDLNDWHPKPMVEKVISFFDFDTTVSIRLFLGFFGRKMVHCIKLGKPISSSFQKILNAK
jgi:hypothetical protein